ncbi:MAG: alginate O-acetyltransferase AlgX-related protein [Saccharofermentanales bacterium]|jgi:hypothetical protein
MRRRWQMLFVIVVLGSALIPLFCLIAGIDTPRVASEALPPKPDVRAAGGFQRTFTRAFDDYWQHAFPLSSFMITAHNATTRSLFASSTHEQIIVGRDGMLYYGQTLGDITGTGALTEGDAARIAQVLDVERTSVEAFGGRYYVTIAPNKASVYPEYLRRRLSDHAGASNADRLKAKLADRGVYIDLFEPLTSAKDATTPMLYHRLDSHWNRRGAWVAYDALMRATGVDPVVRRMPTVETRDHAGDLAAMFFPDRVTLDLNYAYEDFEGTFTFMRPMRTWEDVRIETASGEGDGHLWMHRDSFANALIPFLSSTFSRATYLRGEARDWRWLGQDPCDVVIVEMVERDIDRFLKKTPILLAPETTMPEIVGTLSHVDVHVETEEKYGMVHHNVRLPDEFFLDDAIVLCGETAVRAFAVHEQDDVNDALTNGISWYAPDACEDAVMVIHTAYGWQRLP